MSEAETVAFLRNGVANVDIFALEKTLLPLLALHVIVAPLGFATELLCRGWRSADGGCGDSRTKGGSLSCCLSSATFMSHY